MTGVNINAIANLSGIVRLVIKSDDTLNKLRLD